MNALTPRLGLNIHRDHWPTAPVLKSHEAAGFAWVQVHTPPIAMLADRVLCRHHARALRRALDTSGLRLVLHAPDDLSVGTIGPDKAGDGLLDYAVESGAELIAYHALNFVASERLAQRALDEERALERLALRAEREGVVIAAENLAPVHPSPPLPPRLCHDPLRVAALVRRVESPGLGMLLDLGHAHITGDVSQVIDQVGGDVVLFHVHDNLGRRKAGPDLATADPLKLDLHLPPGAGTLPWADIAARLEAHDAPLMMEIEPSHRPELPALASTIAGPWHRSTPRRTVSTRR